MVHAEFGDSVAGFEAQGDDIVLPVSQQRRKLRKERRRYAIGQPKSERDQPRSNRLG
ncbi:hypothetical protein BIW11_01928 [Tropilaelaps mercedesae]|uniref:Uncharacterized protein n=1 Tax=Tropilaelaps mercedesae TaxID=418985 RepID=A0A1V9X628_9ACAR|nr:hypothetical protein BIW11_01928 [Tropilaelaps mercedesae]